MSFPSDLINYFARFKTTSALAPLLAAGSILCLTAFGVTWLVGADHTLTWMLWIFILFFWTAFIGGAYVFWSIKNPNRLQTEDFQYKALQVLTDERHPGKTIEHEPLTSNTVVGVIK
jgi:hypothetical protein